MRAYPLTLIMLLIMPCPAQAQSECAIADKACIMDAIAQSANSIDNQNWQDQTYRELAKTRAFHGQHAEAIALVDRFQNPDTQAMTIRGIGMAVTESEADQRTYTGVFTALRKKAETITHPPSYAIALTYIAMAQAFYGDHDGAWATAAAMENDALRHKAYGETAEIQAEYGYVDEALKSITFIESTAYRSKAYALVSKILANGALYDGSLKAAQAITNPYKKATALQYVLDKKYPREGLKKRLKKDGSK